MILRLSQKRTMKSADDNLKTRQQMKANDDGAGIRLRAIERDDLLTLYEYQLDPEANRLALTYPRSADAFDAHWKSALGDPSLVVRAIVVGDVLAGCISCFKVDGHDSVGYWIGKQFWGQGVATRALELLLVEVSVRPLHARVAVTNGASIRVLQKCGFQIVGHQHSPGDDRYLECEEVILELAEDNHE
jgi:RimJ/RimL family protein N-acetyltransferase